MSGSDAAGWGAAIAAVIAASTAAFTTVYTALRTNPKLAHLQYTADVTKEQTNSINSNLTAKNEEAHVKDTEQQVMIARLQATAEANQGEPPT